MKDQSKEIFFVGDTRGVLRFMPASVRQRLGYQIERIKHGLEPNDWKSIKTVGPGVNEVRVKCKEGAFRVFYVPGSKLIFVLHMFRKTTQKTEKRDIDLAISRFKKIRS